MTLPDWKAAGKNFNYKGRNIFYREEGSGETLLLIHGFPTASWDWYRIWGELVKKYHVIAPDMIGFGFSAKPKNYTYSIMDQADLMEVMMEKMGIESIHLFAHDYGDTVAQELLARWLDRQGNHVQAIDLKSITLLNGGLFPEMHYPRLIQKILASPIGIYLSPFLGRRNLAKTFRDIFGKNTQPTDKEIDDFWHLINHDGGKVMIPRIIKYMHERRHYRDRWVGALEKCPIPLFHINGTDDPISGRHSGEYFQKIAPQVKAVFLEGIGHYPQVEAPEATLNAFFNFMEK